MTLHTKKVNRLIASMAKEAGGQRSWKNVFPDHRCFTTSDFACGVKAACCVSRRLCSAVYTSDITAAMEQDNDLQHHARSQSHMCS